MGKNNMNNTMPATSPRMFVGAEKQMAQTQAANKGQQLWIEDLPLENLKLDYQLFKVTYKEFIILTELTILILEQMGIFLKQLTQPKNTQGRIIKTFEEFDDNSLEQQMEEDGLY